MAIAFLFSIIPATGAHNNPEKDGEVIVIVIDEFTNGNGQGRSLQMIPLSAWLYRTLSYVNIDFLDNLGVVIITLTNQSTGNSTTTQVNSNFGGALIPVSIGSGNYRIAFLTQTTSYEGFFTL